MSFSVKAGLEIESVDRGMLILDPSKPQVFNLVGEQVEAFRAALEGAQSIPADLEPAMAGLIELGLVESPAWSRRRVLQAGGAAAAAAVAVVALPSVAAAASVTTLPPAPGSVQVNIQMMDGLTNPAKSPLRVPTTGDENVSLYAAADRTSTLISSVGTHINANDSLISYTFTNVAPGTYYADIQQPFQQLGEDGVPTGSPLGWIDWNYAHSTPGVGYPAPVPDYQQAVVTSGNVTVINVSIQVQLTTTKPAWAT